jgi:tRNA A-37 threonylcarbamoyl transferase component Bud32
MGGLFVLDLTINSDQRIADIFRMRGWIYAAGAGLALVAYWNRQKWIDVIDRRFFRERYNAQHLLRDVVGEIRVASHFEDAANRVVERIESALHPEFVSVMIHAPGESEYRAIATAPKGQLPPKLSAENKVVALVHVLGKPLELLSTNSAWLDDRLPQDESEFVRNARIDLLVPVASGTGRSEALLSCGIKRSEEPYTHEDQQLLETIATNLALRIEMPAAAIERSPETFAECPECGTCYEPSRTSCSSDDEQLIPVRASRMLASRYRLERRRGKGGMGAVYEATDAALQRRVAIKLIRDDLVDSVDARQRFRGEARAAANFTHPNVVTIFDYGVEGDMRAFLVMELLRGATLRDEIRQNKRLLPARVVQLMRGVCLAVGAAHQHGLIHRDLKPENVFIANRGESTELIKVLDFGIAKFLPSEDDAQPTRAETQTGILVGTPAYMSPEQINREELHILWDMWALGVLTYEALTGALPFSTTGGNWPRSVLSGAFTPLSAHLDHPGEKLSAFFAQAFASDRKERPQSAAEFFARMEQAFSG